METEKYTIFIPGGTMTVIIPLKEMEILRTLDQKVFKTQWEALDESKRLYMEQYPQEAKEFYEEKY
jgi:hypothetical protein